MWRRAATVIFVCAVGLLPSLTSVQAQAFAPGVVSAAEQGAADTAVAPWVLGDPPILPTSTIRVENSAGEQFNGTADRPRMSADGRYVAFDSRASNVIPGVIDRNSHRDVFVYDRETGTNELVSAGLGGEQANGLSTLAGISGDGRYVVFSSAAANLVPDDTSRGDVFRYDRELGLIEEVSVGLGGENANGFSTRPEASTDGRWIAFTSSASNLVDGDANGKKDVFVRDMLDGVTYLVSKASSGVQGDADSFRPEISGDGAVVTFASDATTLSAIDTNDKRDIYVHDMTSATTKLVSINHSGSASVSHSSRPSISRDGRWVAFRSVSRDIVAGDTNSSVDSFLRDIVDDVTYPVSLDAEGQFSSGDSDRPVVSADGRFVVFNSSNNNLVEPDSGRTDVFVRDMQQSVTHRVTISLTGTSPSGRSYRPEISDDATVIVYRSSADDIVADDTNGEFDLFIATMDYEGGGSDTEAPSVPTGVVAASSGSSIDITWGASTDNVGVDHYEVMRDTALRGSAVTAAFLDDNGGVGFEPGAFHSYEVVAVDAVGNRSLPSEPVSVLAGVDTEAPWPAPGGPFLVESSGSSITVGWTASADNVSVRRYKVVRDGSTVTNVGLGATSYVDEGLVPATSYAYRIVALDAAGNRTSSPTVVLTTDGGGVDIEAPWPAPGGPFLVESSGSSITVGWTASADNVSVRRYKVVRDGSTVTNVGLGATSYVDEGLVPATSYAYRIVALDAAGNRTSSPTVVLSTDGGADTARPKATLTEPTENATVAGPTVRFAGTATDNVGVVEVGLSIRNTATGLYLRRDGAYGSFQLLATTLDSPAGVSTTWSEEFALEGGSYTVRVVTRDAAGNEHGKKPTATFVVN